MNVYQDTVTLAVFEGTSKEAGDTAGRCLGMAVAILVGLLIFALVTGVVG